LLLLVFAHEKLKKAMHEILKQQFSGLEKKSNAILFCL